MQLKEFSLLSPQVESGTVPKALETTIPTEAIEQAIAQTNSNEERKRALPSHLVICLVIKKYLFFTWLVKEILDEQIPKREARSNPRVVKKTRAKFPSKKPIHKGAKAKRESLSFSIVNSA
jgi:hypothetical protein